MFNKVFFLFALLCTLSALSNDVSAHTEGSSIDFEHFIHRDGHQLKDGDEVFRFAGIHAPELHRIEDDARGVCKADKRGWGQHFKWPTSDEQENWIKALVKTGHKAMRIYVLSVAQQYDQVCDRETHILAPLKSGDMPRLNENAMVVYDQMIALASEHKLRLILPFIDHWKWWGGREQLAAFYDEKAADFYKVDSKTYQAYQSIIEQVINRKNTLTGRYYYQEKAIMAWETGNELRESTTAFVTKTAAHIKRLAPNQLVVDGNYLSILESSLIDPNVDIISNHFYTVNGNNNPETVKKNLTTIAGKKPYLVGEYGLESPEHLNKVMQAVVNTEIKGAKAVGAFIWGFRGHRHDGGFYWHREGGGPHYSYHLPGFVEGDANNEIAVIDLVRKAQAQMAGLTKIPALPIPEAPKLRNVSEDKKLTWMGSPVARYYRIERKITGQKSWQVIAENISDGKNRFMPNIDTLFQDTFSENTQNTKELLVNAEVAYRVIAQNESGDSIPSNVIKVKL
ncbi:MAG: beta-mannanase man5E [Colwellia sp.]